MTPSPYLFPHDPLTPIVGKPNAASLRTLTNEVYTNLQSVKSPRGGGCNGHLGLAMPPEAYILRAGVPFIAPEPPGLLPVYPSGTTAIAVTTGIRAYDYAVAEREKYETVRDVVRGQILTAVPGIYVQGLRNSTHGFHDIPLHQLLAHLHSKYGTMSYFELEANRNMLMAPWPADAPLESLWAHIQSIQDTAAAGGVPICPEIAIELTLVALAHSGSHARALSTWDERPKPDKTWDHFVDHLTLHEELRTKQLTAAAAGYHHANIAPTMATPTAHSLPPPPEHHLSAIAPPSTTYKGAELYYCHTHGVSKNPLHTSASCNNKGPRHVDDATCEDRKGGLNQLNFGKSGQPRRLAVNRPTT
jgi:hypothetical protein